MPIFHPFGSNRPSFIYNKSISRQLDNPGLPKVPYPDFPPGPYLRPFIKASGLTPEGLCERLQRPGGKTTITPELLETALTDYDPEMWIICRIFKALDLSWDDYRLLEEKHYQLHKEAKTKYQQAKKLYLLYQKMGPRLHTLMRYEDWLLFSPHLTNDHLMLQLNTGSKYAFIIPTTEGMGNIIATERETCIHPIVQELDIATAFLYHRHPQELHLYDNRGNLLATGDTQITIPKGLILI
jgi:hypothetical protein